MLGKLALFDCFQTDFGLANFFFSRFQLVSCGLELLCKFLLSPLHGVLIGFGGRTFEAQPVLFLLTAVKRSLKRLERLHKLMLFELCQLQLLLKRVALAGRPRQQLDFLLELRSQVAEFGLLARISPFKLLN